MTSAIEQLSATRVTSQEAASKDSCFGRFLKRIKNCLSKPETFMLAGDACLTAGVALFLGAPVLGLPIGLALVGTGAVLNIIGLAIKAYQCRSKKAHKEQSNHPNPINTAYPLCFEPPEVFLEPHTMLRGMKHALQIKSAPPIDEIERARQSDLLQEHLSIMRSGDALMASGAEGCTHSVITFVTSDSRFHTVSASKGGRSVVCYSSSFLSLAVQNHANLASFSNKNVTAFDSQEAAFVRGLNTDAMYAFVKKTKGKYKFATLHNNCSRYASNVLLAGVPEGHQRHFEHDRCCQMPRNALSLAREVNFHLNRVKAETEHSA